MDNIKIFFLDDTTLAEYEAVNKGYRIDIFVEIDEKFYNVRAYSLIRLQQDYETEMEASGFYYTEPNMIIVRDANKEEIVYAINRHYKGKYFDGIKSVQNMNLEKLTQVQ